MFPAKIYIGQIAVVFGIVFTSTWGATQWTASALGYQDGLGSPWFTLSGYPVYLPWRLFEWWYAYEAYAPEIFERAGAMSAGGGIAGALFAVVNPYGVPGKINWSRPTARHAGRRQARSLALAYSEPKAFSLVASTTTTSAMMVQNM